MKLYSFIIFSNLKYQVIMVKKIHSMPTVVRLQQEIEKKVVEQQKAVHQ